MTEQLAAEVTLPKPPRSVLGEAELFPTEIVTKDGYFDYTDRIVHAISACGETWATFQTDRPTSPQGYDTIGGKVERVQRARAQLARIFRIGPSGWLVAYEDMDEQLAEIGRESPSEVVNDLNAKIEADPSDLMLGISVAIGEGVSLKAAKLEGLYVDEKGKNGPIIRPVLSGERKRRSRLKLARGVGIYGVFAQASPRGVLQIDERKREIAEHGRIYGR